MAALVRQALDAFADQDFEVSAHKSEEAKADAPRSGRIRELLGLSYYRAGQYRDALRELLAYRRLTGRKDQNHVIADCYRATGRPEKALEIAGEVSPRDVTADVWAELLIVSASTLADQGEVERGLAQIARGDLNPAALEPYHLRLWYIRADLLERANRRDEARAVWERIAAEDPDFYDVAERLSR